MSPNGLEETEPVREEVEPGVLQWSITSQPPTPRKGDKGGQQVPSLMLHSEYEQAFENVCCQCGEMMPTGGVVCCCRCVHRCHEECKHFCENEAIVCIHCKRSYFLQGQPFHPPMTHEDLLRNIEFGISIPRGSKVRNLEERRLAVLQGIALNSPENPGTSGLRAGVSGEVNVEGGTSGLRAGVSQMLCQPCTTQPTALVPGATQRSASHGKRNLEQIAEPPGLNKPDDPKVRRIQNVFSLDIQTHVEVLQQIVQRFDIQIINNVSSEEVNTLVKEIWSVLGEVAMHLHSVSHFASQGFEQQGLHCQSLQGAVDILSFEVKQCVFDIESVVKTNENLQKQYEYAAQLRGRVDKLQLQMAGVLTLLEGVRTPLTEAFSGIYQEKKRIDDLNHRVDQLETAGIHASDKDLNLDGSPLMEDVKKFVEEKLAAQLKHFSSLDVRQHTFARELEKVKSDLADSREESGSTFRKENMKLRDDVQARLGTDLDQRIRKHIEQYVKTASGADQGVRIELYAKTLNEVKESQKRTDQRCHAAEERCSQLITEHLDTVARLEKRILEY
eukprot:2770140-Amphidinium_carterae.1